MNCGQGERWGAKQPDPVEIRLRSGWDSIAKGAALPHDRRHDACEGNANRSGMAWTGREI